VGRKWSTGLVSGCPLSFSKSTRSIQSMASVIVR
jgi:hypothetical protein